LESIVSGCHAKVIAMILDCSEVLPDRLWVGTYVRPEDVMLLRQMGVTTVVNLQSDQDIDTCKIRIKKLLKAYDQVEIEHRRVATPDFDQNALAANLELSIAELEAALVPRWTKVYLHCTAGINRGPTVAAAFLMRSRGYSAQKAYEYITARRHCSPYFAVLEEYESSLAERRIEGPSC
jgi:protein-tyrosine phosphatase